MMCPINDSFLSGSLDRTIRLWDLRSPNCQGLMHLNGRPVTSFDPEGLIFAAGIESRQLKLYDLRTFDKVGEGGRQEGTIQCQNIWRSANTYIFFSWSINLHKKSAPLKNLMLYICIFKPCLPNYDSIFPLFFLSLCYTHTFPLLFRGRLRRSESDKTTRTASGPE